MILIHKETAEIYEVSQHYSYIDFYHPEFGFVAFDEKDNFRHLINEFEILGFL